MVETWRGSLLNWDLCFLVEVICKFKQPYSLLINRQVKNFVKLLKALALNMVQINQSKLYKRTSEEENMNSTTKLVNFKKERKKDILRLFRGQNGLEDQTRDYFLSVVSSLRTTTQNKINITR